MKQLHQKYQWFVFVVIVVIGMSGCQSELRDMGTITAPAGTEDLMNFWAGKDKRGDYEHYYYEEGSREFEFDTPAGDWGLGYQTNYGTFIVIFRAKEAATIHIGLQPNDTIYMVATLSGQIIPGSTVLTTSGKVEVYSWPGDPIPPEQVFIPDLPPEEGPPDSTSSALSAQPGRQLTR